MASQGILSQCFCWLPCFGGGDDDNEETSIQCRSGNQTSFWQWQKSVARHLFGQFSMATVQANLRNEDRCQLVSGNLTDNCDGPRGVFVGVYDGHGGARCSQFVLENLFNNMKTAIANQPGNADIRDVIRNGIEGAYEETENTFVQLAKDNWHQQVELATTGSCCLVGLVHDNVLYVANAGDSRAVVARGPKEGPLELVVQLSTDYSANDSAIREEVQAEHPNEMDLFKRVGESWRVRGMLGLTRAIGDGYLKWNEFHCNTLPARFRTRPIVRPILKANPTVQTYQLSPRDRFVIFASDGLWDQMENAEAAEIVSNTPRSGAAAALIRRALEKAAGKIEIEYEQLRSMRPYYRRFFHDDISVVILYFDHLEEAQAQAQPAESGPGAATVATNASPASQ